MKIRIKFSAGDVTFGVYAGKTWDEAREAFASDAGYLSWSAMVEQAKDFFGGHSIKEEEVEEGS